MSGNSAVTMARDNLIINALAQPLTIEQLKDIIKINIHTLRKDIQRLQSTGMIRPTGQVINRKPTYVVASARPIPDLFRKRTNSYINPVKIMQGYAANPNSLTASMKAARYLNDAISELLNLSATSKDNTPQQLSEALNEIRSNLKEAFQVLGEHVDLIQQVLSNNAWWSVSSLKDFAKDESFDSELIEQAYSQILQNRDTERTE